MTKRLDLARFYEAGNTETEDMDRETLIAHRQRLHALLAACAVLLALLAALGVLISLLGSARRASALLLLPHLLWGLFALLLNVGILLLNAA